jgi:GH24 family phage-related lysozyme (muramidase)
MSLWQSILAVLLRVFGKQTPPPAPQPSAPASTPESVAIEEAVSMDEQFEGFEALPYQDPGNGTWTQGYGSTHDLNGDPITAHSPAITQPMAVAWMRRDMQTFSDEVASAVTVPLTVGERAALDSFVYNLGGGNLRRSTLLRLLNAGDYAGAAKEFDKWNMAGGKVLAGLVRRRQAETDMFTRA